MTIRETIKKGMINLKTNGIEEPKLKSTTSNAIYIK